VQYKLPKIDIDKEAIRAFFKTDRGILLISMGISLLFWLLVKLSQNHRANRQVAISYTLPADMSFVTIPPDQVRVTLEGRGWDLMYDYFGRRNNAVNFDLASTVLQNITNNQLKGRMVDNTKSSNITVEDMSFDYISIELGKSSIKKVPIILDRQLNFAAEHQLKSSIQLMPDSVTLSGPNSMLENYTGWPTTLLSLKNLKNTVTRPIPLQPNNTPQIKLSASVVQVHIPVEQFTEKSIFVPVMVKGAPDSLKVFPNKVKTNFVVGLSQYDSISEKNFRLEVDLKGVPINQSNNTAPILLTQQPTEVKHVQFSPKSVQFLFVKEED